ncbi:hypothetical protein WN982_29465 [Paraburkholderia sp. IMGN_8]|uniref:hypothetical protein n=1 Tax=Paraburkholderia sp. IMGN_8 TaxID=3136564 RepID=UPI003100DD57
MFVKSFVTFCGGTVHSPRLQRLVCRALHSHIRTNWAARVGHVGGPLTPTGYAIVAITVAAVALVAMLSTSSVGNELNRTLRLSWWFS